MHLCAFLRPLLADGVLLLGLQLLAYFANTLGYNLVPVRRTYRRGLIHC